MLISYFLKTAFSVVSLGDNNSSFLPFRFTQLTELFVFDWMTVGLLWRSHDIIFTSRNIFVFGSRIFWRTELLSFCRNARNVRRNLREHKEHLNCKQSCLLESVVEFTHFLANSAPSVLLLDFFPSLWLLLLYIVVLGLTLKPSPLVYCANAGKFLSLALFEMLCPPRGGALPIMAYTGRLRPKGVPFSRFRYMKG